MSLLENWLIVGLFLSWVGLMCQRYWPKAKGYCQPPVCPWWHELIGIALWPFAFALGIVMSKIIRNRGRKK